MITVSEHCAYLFLKVRSLVSSNVNRRPADPGLCCFSQQLCPNMWGKYLSVYLLQEILRVLIFQRNIDDVFFPGSTKVPINLRHSAKRSSGIFSQLFPAIIRCFRACQFNCGNKIWVDVHILEHINDTRKGDMFRFSPK